MDLEPDRRPPPAEYAVPRWMPTFADVMTLLMCFFVLLLSFAEMDVRRYRQIAGSMAEAFGVQRLTEVDAIPMGTSIIARDFVPAPVQPTPISEPYLPAGELKQLQSPPQPEPPPEPKNVELTEQMKRNVQALIRQTQDDAAALAQQLAGPIGRGEVEVEARGRTIVLRIREKGSFNSGSADLQPVYQGLLHQVRDTVAKQGGALMIRGHTDDVPIATARFRSNWELSSARAVSVAQELLAERVIDPRRISISGHADTRPLVPNDSPEHRARNRRVEIVINQGIDRDTREQLEALKTEDRAYYDSLKLQDEFNLSPDEVF
jgi:chemotaxis protein MotB